MSESIQYLIQGYKNFRQRYFEEDNSLYEDLVKKGQQPKYLVIACSDSRVDPALIMNCEPGDLFVIRNVANLIPPCEHDSHYHGTSAALEFGICSLGIKHIILLGHSQCGGINALLENYKGNKRFNLQNQSFLSKWVEIAKPGCEQTLKDFPLLATNEQADICARNSLLYSLENLNSFPWIKKAVEQGELFLHAWFFDLNNGKINFYNADKKQFDEL